MFVTTKFRDVAKYPHVIVGYVFVHIRTHETIEDGGTGCVRRR